MVSSFSTMAWQGLAMAALVSAGVADLEVRQAPVVCSNLHIMAAGGCQLPCTQAGLGLLSSTVAGISAAIPGSDLYLVPYNGAPNQAAVSTPILVQAVEQYVAQCPNTPIVLVGYSLGGIVVTNAVCNGLPYEKNIIASVTYGEETFSFPQPYDRGTCRANAPKFSRVNTAGCQKFAPVMRSYCDAEDPQCCTGGIAPAAHFTYAQIYNAEVVAFVQSQYGAFGPRQIAPVSPSTPSSPATSSSFPTAPFYPNATIPQPNGGSAPAGGNAPAGAGAFTQTTTYTSVGADTTRVITETLTVTRVTTIPLFQPTGITTPVIPATGSFIPLSDVVETSAPARVGDANSVVAAGASSGIVVASPTYVVPSPYSSSPAGPNGPVGPVGTGGASPYNPSSTLTPFSGNGAGSLAPAGLFSAVAVLALGLLL